MARFCCFPNRRKPHSWFPESFLMCFQPFCNVAEFYLECFLPLFAERPLALCSPKNEYVTGSIYSDKVCVALSRLSDLLKQQCTLTPSDNIRGGSISTTPCPLCLMDKKLCKIQNDSLHRWFRQWSGQEAGLCWVGWKSQAGFRRWYHRRRRKHFLRVPRVTLSRTRSCQ